MPRPRNTEFDDRILAAATRLIDEGGYEALTMNAIAREAGVGKPALYRRFADKGEVVMSLTVARGTPPLDTDTGSFDGDMRVAFGILVESLAAAPRSIMGAQIGLAVADPDASRRLVERIIEPANAQMMPIWRRAVERGELREGLDPVVWLTTTSAAFIHGVLVLHWPPDGPWVHQVVDGFLRATMAA